MNKSKTGKRSSFQELKGKYLRRENALVQEIYTLIENPDGVASRMIRERWIALKENNLKIV